MKKKVLSVVMSLVIVFSLSVTSFASASLPNSRDYLKKAKCLLVAAELVSDRYGDPIVKDMSGEDVAKEIFAHAVLYYGADKPIIKTTISVSDYVYIKKHGEVIDIEDGGDSRAWTYSVIWDLMA